MEILGSSLKPASFFHNCRILHREFALQPFNIREQPKPGSCHDTVYTKMCSPRKQKQGNASWDCLISNAPNCEAMEKQLYRHTVQQMLKLTINCCMNELNKCTVEKFVQTVQEPITCLTSDNTELHVCQKSAVLMTLRGKVGEIMQKLQIPSTKLIFMVIYNSYVYSNMA